METGNLNTFHLLRFVLLYISVDGFSSIFCSGKGWGQLVAFLPAPPAHGAALGFHPDQIISLLQILLQVASDAWVPEETEASESDQPDVSSLLLNNMDRLGERD